MHRYFIELAYNGKDFHGWQVQPNSITVQEVVVDALRKALRKDVNLVGCGRTDTGVHASYFVAHFDVDALLDDTDQLVYKLNRIVGNNIVVNSMQLVSNDTHSRFHATSRTYHYYIQVEKNPFSHTFAYRPFYKVDIKKMNAAAKVLFAYSDFTSFSKLHTDSKTNNCTIMKAEWIEQEGGFVFVIKADRFLRNMVRAIVGTLLEVGRSKISIDEFRRVIELKNRGKAGTSVPAQALFLVDVEYPSELFDKKAHQYPPFYHL